MKLLLIAAAMAVFASPAFAEEKPPNIYFFAVDLDFVQKSCANVKFTPDALAKVNDKVRDLRRADSAKGPATHATPSECERKSAGINTYAQSEFGISGLIASTEGESGLPEYFDAFLIDLGFALGPCQRAGHIQFSKSALNKVNQKIAELKSRQGTRYITVPEEPPSDPSELKRVCRDLVSYSIDDFAAEQLDVSGLVAR
ncbi:hypothetical protein [Agrobacterium sp. LAD9]|uniref:hypothetical protein n=1 Tax=Agrobacterium sp. LAD9 TaxID=2055153 RepID=UPI000D1E81AC|nr:hypothetical protein [Agrobacterium sp. LAD9]